MWLRAVHSFISASLTGISDIWASVAGYYSSHYWVEHWLTCWAFFSPAHTEKDR